MEYTLSNPAPFVVKPNILKRIYHSLKVTWIFFRMQFALRKIHHTQPLYNFALLKNKQPQRIAMDKADAIYQAIKAWGPGGHILDLNCSLGFYSHYFADRGYVVTGVDSHKPHLLICKLLQGINAKKTLFVRNKLSTVIDTLGPHDYEIAFLLNDYEISESLLSAILEKIPVLFIQVSASNHKIKDILIQLATVHDCQFQKIKLFSNTEGTDWQIIYMFQKNHLKLCGEMRQIIHRKFTSHYEAGFYGRHYYDCGDVYVKKYFLPQRNNNVKNILQEIKNYQLLPANTYFPELICYTQDKDSIEMAFTKLPGNNLYDLLAKGEKVSILRVFTDVVNGLEVLHASGLYHNDIRIWNIMYDKERAYLFDLGLTSSQEKENTNIALLWIILQLHTFNYYKFNYPITKPPAFNLEDFSLPVQKIIVALQETRSFKEFLRKFR